MRAIIEIGNEEYTADLSKPHDIGIMLQDGINNPNCFFADRPSILPYTSGNFIGDIEKGSPVNFKNVFFNPHGNGTHTECSGHIRNNGLVVGNLLKKYFFLSRLISIFPEEIHGDWILGYNVDSSYFRFPQLEALIVRTMPNFSDKKLKNYSGSNPPYFDAGFIECINKEGIQHLLTDLPSVDKEKDGGKLSSHRSFWDNSGKNRTRCTITELIFVPDYLKDGIYLLELQLMNLSLDAAPSRPVIYELNKREKTE